MITSPPAARSDGHAARILFGWLVLVSFYRFWLVPRLGITLYVDEAQYWTWAQHLDWGYFSKPPLIAWLIAATTTLFGDGLLAVKAAGMLCYPLTAWILFLAGRELFDARIGLRAGIAFSLLPFVSGLGLFVSTDAPLMFFWALAMFAFARALRLDRKRDWLLLGAAVGLGTMAKYTMLAFGACALLYLLADRKHWRTLRNGRLWAAVALAVLIALPNLFWNWAEGFPTLLHTADITHVDGHNEKTGNALEYLAGQFISLGPLLALAFFASAIALLRHWRDATQAPQRLLHACAWPLLLLVLLQALRAEANSNWAAPAFVSATLAAVAWLSLLRARWFWLAIGLNAALMVAAYHLPDLYRLRGEAMPARIDVLKRARGWDQLARQLRPILAAQPDAVVLAANRTLIAHLHYELRDMPLRFAAWRAQALPQDHYQLTVPLQPSDLGHNAILISQDDSEAIRSRFARATKLAQIRVQGPSIRREVEVWRLDGFLGYR